MDEIAKEKLNATHLQSIHQNKPYQDYQTPAKILRTPTAIETSERKIKDFSAKVETPAFGSKNGS